MYINQKINAKPGPTPLIEDKNKTLEYVVHTTRSKYAHEISLLEDHHAAKFYHEN